MFCFFLCINQPGHPVVTDSFFFYVVVVVVVVVYYHYFIFYLGLTVGVKKVLVCIAYYGRAIAHRCPITWRHYGCVWNVLRPLNGSTIFENVRRKSSYS